MKIHDKYRICSFVAYDFVTEPLRLESIVAIDEFVWDLREEMTLNRRTNDIVLRNHIIDFINVIEDYAMYLGLQMDSDDRENWYRLKNIDLNFVQRNVVEYRTELNKLYSLISNGRRLLVTM